MNGRRATVRWPLPRDEGATASQRWFQYSVFAIFHGIQQIGIPSQLLFSLGLSLFPLGRDTFYHRDSISRDKIQGEQVTSIDEVPFLGTRSEKVLKNVMSKVKQKQLKQVGHMQDIIMDVPFTKCKKQSFLSPSLSNVNKDLNTCLLIGIRDSKEDKNFVHIYMAMCCCLFCTTAARRKKRRKKFANSKNGQS